MFIITVMFYTIFLLLLFVFAFPLFVIISFGILFSSGRPIFFTQPRIGKDGKPFTIYKFRTMYIRADKDQKKYASKNEVDGPVFKIHDDPRFTPIGKFLSHTGLDELPQLANVIRGDMALFGPRPLPVSEEKHLLSWQRERQQIKPGILSPWVFRGYHKRTFVEWMRDDIDYVHKKNAWYDIQLFFQSAVFIVRLFVRELVA